MFRPGPRLLRHFGNDPHANHNLRHSIYDGMAYSVMTGGGETYFTPFALFLKATAGQIAMLSTLPPLIGSLAQLLSVWLDHKSGRRKPVILSGAWLQALIWLPLIGLIGFADARPVLPLFMVLTLYYAGGHLTTPCWIRLMGDIVPERRRGRYFAYRTRLVAVFSLTALISAGAILHFFDGQGLAWAGFASIFTIACCARLISIHQLRQMQEPVMHHAAVDSSLKVLQVLQHGPALWFTLFFVLMQMAVCIAAPFFAVYMLRDLQFSYLQFTANTGTAVLIQFVTLNRWGRIGDVFGNRIILYITAMLVPMLPMLWVVSTNFWYLITIQVLSGLAWGGFNLSSGNLLLDLVPAARRTVYVAFHNVFAACGVFLGGSIGVLLVGILPQRHTWFGDSAISSPLLNIFLISTAVRYLIVVVFLRKVKEQRKVRRPTRSDQHIYRLSRFSAFMGLSYEPVTTAPREQQRGASDSGSPL